MSELPAPTGTPCTQQLEDLSYESVHPMELLADVVTD